jgi:hypothetical protein
MKMYAVLNWPPRQKDIWGSGGIPARILNLGAIWRWGVSFTLRPLYHRLKSPQFGLDRRLGGPQNRSGRVDWRENFPAPAGNRTRQHRLSNPDTSLYTDWAIAAPLITLIGLTFGAEYKKLLTLNFSPFLYYYCFLRSKCSPQHSNLTYRQSVFFSQGARPSFTPRQKKS